MPTKNKQDWAVLHTAKFNLPNRQGEFVKVCLQNVKTNESKVIHIKNPKRSFWVAKKQFRIKGNACYYNYKKECEKIENLEKFECLNHELPTAIYKALGGKMPYMPILNQALNSPYIYGADVNIEVLIKKKYKEHCSGSITNVAMGFIDIETSLLPQSKNQIIISSFVDHNKNLHISVYRPFIKGGLTDEDVTAHVMNRLENITGEEFGYKLSISYFDTEEEVIRDTFKYVHASKITMCGIWNIDYDIPQFVRRMEFLGLDPNELFNAPETPKEYRHFYYHHDKRDAAHITDKWHYGVTGSRVFFIDSMLLYSRVRKTAGRKIKYTLDYTASQELNMSKLEFGKALGHVEMQRDHFTDYIAYGGLDPVLTHLLELKNKDVLGVIGTIGNSRIQDYSKPTTILKDDFYSYYLSNGYVGGTAGSSMRQPYDHLLICRGGAVLPTDRFTGTGLCVLEEAPTVETLVSRAVADLDLKALYPSLTDAFNVSKGTKISTCIGIEGYSNDIVKQDIIKELCFGLMTSPEANAVQFCNTFFDLPDYSEMESLVNERLNN